MYPKSLTFFTTILRLSVKTPLVLSLSYPINAVVITL